MSLHEHMINFLVKIYKRIDKKIFPWYIHKLGKRTDSMESPMLDISFPAEVDGTQFVLQLDATYYCEEKDLYMIELSFYHTHHDETGSHENMCFIEYIHGWAIKDDPETNALARWVGKYSVLKKQWLEETKC